MSTDGCACAAISSAPSSSAISWSGPWTNAANRAPGPRSGTEPGLRSARSRRRSTRARAAAVGSGQWKVVDPPSALRSSASASSGCTSPENRPATVPSAPMSTKYGTLVVPNAPAAVPCSSSSRTRNGHFSRVEPARRRIVGGVLAGVGGDDRDGHAVEHAFVGELDDAGHLGLAVRARVDDDHHDLRGAVGLDRHRLLVEVLTDQGGQRVADRRVALAVARERRQRGALDRDRGGLLFGRCAEPSSSPPDEIAMITATTTTTASPPNTHTRPFLTSPWPPARVPP